MITAVRNRDANDKHNAVVMPRNTQIPGKVSEIFTTITDYQTTLLVSVNEGEGEDLDYVTKIGEGTMKLTPRPVGSPHEVFFEYDENQIIRVNVYDKVDNKHLGEIRIERKANMNDEQVASLAVMMQKTTVN